jgi:hypothetical protein
MVQNKAVHVDTVSFLDYVGENLSDIKCGDCDSEIDDNHKCGCKRGTSDSDRQAVSVISD